jgi:hypothetical protein
VRNPLKRVRVHPARKLQPKRSYWRLNNGSRPYGPDEEVIEVVVEHLAELEKEVAEVVEKVPLVAAEEEKTEVVEGEVGLVLVVAVVVHKASMWPTRRLSPRLVRDLR